MIYDAVILTGGRASRLDGVSKASLVVGGSTLLERTLAAASGARQIVVVGDELVPTGVWSVRELPRYAGPAAGIAAGRLVLQDLASDFTLVLASDIPELAGAVAALLASAPARDGVIATDGGGRDQYLLALYATPALDAAIAASDPQDLAVRALVDGLDLYRVRAPIGTTEDVDTWTDVDHLGVTVPRSRWLR